jgi:GNAT superfamily N-acetyltransferase
MKILIRKAQRSDIEILIGFQQAMALETEALLLDDERLKQGVEGVFNDSARGEYFIAEADEMIAGCLMITREWSDWRAKTILWIQSVYVLPQYRGKGVYSVLYQHICSKVTNDLSLGGIRLYVDKRNGNALEVYSKLGMDGSHYQLFEWMK